jgi:hypothetical protein
MSESQTDEQATKKTPETTQTNQVMHELEFCRKVNEQHSKTDE